MADVEEDRDPDPQPVPGTETAGAPPAFAVRTEITAEYPLVQQLRTFLADQRITIAGVEFMETTDGRTVVYDINTNTNYNPAVEETAPASGSACAAPSSASSSPSSSAPGRA